MQPVQQQQVLLAQQFVAAAVVVAVAESAAVEPGEWVDWEVLQLCVLVPEESLPSLVALLVSLPPRAVVVAPDERQPPLDVEAEQLLLDDGGNGLLEFCAMYNVGLVVVGVVVPPSLVVVVVVVAEPVLVPSVA